jgi:PIN domain nuclease of toxin-antitoxin system
MDNVVRRGECVGVSAISLLEIALLEGGRDRLVMGLNDLFHQLETRTTFHIIPLSTDVAREVFSLGSALRDPADRVIVATARVHHLTLLTADQRIIESNLVPVVE